MAPIRWCTLGVLGSLAMAIVGCRTEPPAKTAQGSADPRTIATACRSDQDIDPAVRQAVEEAARTLHAALRRGDHDALWQALHPQARDEAGRATFEEAARDMTQRLAGADETAALEQVHVVAVEGGVTDLTRITCGSGGAPKLQLLANVGGGEDVALVVLRSEGRVFGYATTVQLRRRGQTWHLVGVQVGPASYRQKDAAAIEKLAIVELEHAKMVPAYILFALAQTLAQRGTAVATAADQRLGATLQQLREDPRYKAELATWTVGGDSYSIHDVTLLATQSDLSPVIKYINERGLVAEFLGRDADALMDHVRTSYPELGEVFDAVVFEAYAERPAQPDTAYEAYRVARFFRPPPSG